MAKHDLESLREGDKDDIIEVERVLTYWGRRHWVVQTLEKGLISANTHEGTNKPLVTIYGKIHSSIITVAKETDGHNTQP